MREFLESGVHFGHQTSLWNPKMEEYIFGKKDGIHIIDLRKTEKLLLEAADYLREISSQGKRLLFVGTKRQAQNIICEEAKRCDMFYVNQRWLGGTLTNFNTIRKSISRFKELKEMKRKGTMELLSKKEKSQLTKEMERLRKNLEGIEDMKEYPDALFIVDPSIEDIAVKEARKLSIPIVAITDTNCDPDMVDYPIPSNDDAIKSIKLITTLVTDSILEGKKEKIESLEETVSKEKEEEREEEEKEQEDKESKEEKEEGEISKGAEDMAEEVEEENEKKIEKEKKSKKKKMKSSSEEE